MTKIELVTGAQGISEQLPVLQLPTDHPRKAQQRADHAVCTFAFTKEETDRLQAVEQQAQTSWPATLFAGFLLLLHRYTQQGDVLVGSSFAAGEWGAKSPFLVRTDVSAVQTVPELLTQVQLAIERGQADEKELPMDALGSVSVALEIGAAGWFADREPACELHLQIEDTSTGLVGHFTYNVELWEQATIERMAGHFQRLLLSIAEHPAARLPDLRMLSEAETEQLLVEWNATEVDFGQVHILHHLIEAQVERTPDRIAILFEGKSMTYRELNNRANQLAHHLRKLGAGPDVMIGISVERSLEMMVGLIGILKSGSAYVPMDPTYPKDRLAYMLEDANVPVLLTQAHLLTELPEHGAEVICLDRDWATIASESAANPEGTVTADHLAYMIYTSGSTGKPKGAMNNHRGIVNRLLWMVHEFKLTGEERVMQKTPFSFDVSLWELFTPLITGAQLVIARPEMHKDAAYLVDLIRREEITMIHFVPAMLNIFLMDPDVRKCLSIRHVLCSGEALPYDLQERFFSMLPAKLHNLYGPTETAVEVTYWACQRNGKERMVPIGRPVANTQMYILDKALQPVPIGIAGELHIGGVQVGRGYLHRDDLTAEKFIADPFSTKPGARLYKTGDSARFRADGTIEYMGRIDNQVKVGGLRIEVGEIEAALTEHPAVRETVVLVKEIAPGNKRMLAYFVAATPDVPDASELKQFLSATLPDNMMPDLLIEISDMPLSPSGKVDRKALLELKVDIRNTKVEYVAPRTDMETKVERIFAELLHVEKVGVFDHFFELGGNSLLAIQMIPRMREAFGVTLPLAVVFASATVAKLAEHLEQGIQGEAGLLAQDTTIQRITDEGPLPLSFAQQRLWFFDQYDPMSDLYNVPVALRMQGELNVAALEQALAEIVERHDSLRTVFSNDPDHAVQFILPVQSFSLPIMDLSHQAQADRDARVTELLTEERTWQFNLTSGPLFRVRLLRLSEVEHILLLNMHHIITDGWSMDVFANELAALYGAFVEGKPSPLVELPVQYADFARWQREWLQGEVLEEQLTYWKEKLGGALPVLQLPTDRPRPKQQTFRGEYLPFTLPKSLHEQLKQWSQGVEATLFMTLLAAFQTLLYRYTGQTDILVGAPIAGRNRREIEGLIGFFVNTLVLRTVLSGAPSFRDLVQRVRETAIGAYSHQDVPFEKLVEELQPERDMSHSPLFQVMFTLQDAMLQDVELPGLTVDTIELELNVSKFDISLFMTETDEGLRCGFEYNTDLFDQTTIERMIGHLTTLLESIVDLADQPIAKLPLLTAQERVQMLIEWNDTEVALPENVCLHHLFEQQAQRTPDLIAAVYGEQELTYRELDERANQLARHLQTLGVGPDVPVGVCIERSLELVIGMLGVLKAGGAFLPLDPEAPVDRIRQVVGDAQAPVVLSQSSLRNGLPLDVATFVFVDADRALIDQFETTAPSSDVTPDHLISIYYTSGSTGKPKGVANVHRGWLNRMCWMQRYHQLQPGETVLHKTTVTFDATGIEVFWPLMAGGRIALLEPKLHRDSRAIVDALIRYEVAAVLFVPSMLNLVLEEITADDQARLGRLRLVSSAGEALRPETVKAFQEKLGHISTLHNTWGATEVSICSTNYTCSPADADETDVITLGKPFDNNRVYILDEHLQPVPVGVAGDIYLAGIGLARYYLNNPEKTVEAFVVNPFAPDERLYRTGDRGAYLADGSIRFLGREDNQVKIRGVRVELGEVENVLNQHDGLKEAVVIAHEYLPGDKRLVGYVVPTGQEEVNPADLRAFLKSKLPDYMVPSMIVVLDTLPLNANGKVDRKALPIPELEASESQATYVAPRSDVEARVAQIWSEVLRAEQVGVNDNFFDLGGHSLLATQVVSRIRRAFAIALPVADLFAAPTIAGLAERVAILLAAGSHEQELPIQSVARTGDLTLSFAQQRLYFLDQLEPGSTNYNVPVMLRMRGALDVAALLRSLQEIVQRHESLRTTFTEKDGIAVQVIAPERVLDVPQFDLSNVADREREAALQQLVLREASQPFDLFTGPLFRPCLIVMQPDDHVLFLNSHHIITDGWSMGVFTQELSALYAAFVQGLPSPLAPLAIQYADFAKWQRDWLTGDVLQKQLAYWKGQLGGTLPVLNLAPGQERPAQLSQRGAVHEFEIPAELATAIQAFAEREGATLFMTLLTAYKALLLRHSGQSDLLVGMPIAGRNRSEIEHLIGFFVNTLVLRTDLSGNPTFRDALQRVKKVALEAFTHEDMPYDKLVDELQADRDKGLFQTMFQLLHGSEEQEMHGLQVETAEVYNGTAKFDLQFTVVDHGDGQMVANFEYNRDLYQTSLIERLSKQFLKLLETAMQEPNQHLNSLKLGSEPHGFDEDELDELF